MITKCKYWSVIGDVISLYGLSVANLFIPVLLVPYISGVVGVNQFGVFAVIASFYQYGALVVEYGTTAPMVRMLSMTTHKDSIDAEFFGVVIFKLILAIVSFFFIYIIYYIFFDVIDFWLVFWGALGLLGAALNPLSMFQAKNKLPISSGVTLLVRVITAIITVMLLKHNNHLSVVFFFQFFPTFMIAVILFLMAIRYEWFSFCAPISFIKNKILFNESSSFFLGTVFSSGYTLAVPLFISLFFGHYSAGIYGVIDRVIQPIKQIIMPLINIFYPKICELLVKDREKANLLAGRLTCILGGICLIVIVVSLIFNSIISHYLFRDLVDKSFFIPIGFNVLFVYWSQLLLFLFVIPCGKSGIIKIIYLLMLAVFVACSYLSTIINSINFFYWGLAAVECVGLISFIYITWREVKVL